MLGILPHYRQILQIVRRGEHLINSNLIVWIWQRPTSSGNIIHRVKGCILAYNKHDNLTGAHQDGGTAMVTTNSLSHRIGSRG
jgi:hypothetical protein